MDKNIEVYKVKKEHFYVSLGLVILILIYELALYLRMLQYNSLNLPHFIFSTAVIVLFLPNIIYKEISRKTFHRYFLAFLLIETLGLVMTYV